MSKETILAYINSGRVDKAIIIKWYCWEKGKDPILTEKFIKGCNLKHSTMEERKTLFLTTAMSMP